VNDKWLAAHHTPWCFREDSGDMAGRSERAFIINLDDSSGPGTHWTAARRSGGTLFYADPFGIALSGYPPKELRGSGDRTVVNRISWQRPSTNLCGYYAYLFTKALDKLSPDATQKDLELAIRRELA
jgi:hypothetical protein